MDKSSTLLAVFLFHDCWPVLDPLAFLRSLAVLMQMSSVCRLSPTCCVHEQAMSLKAENAHTNRSLYCTSSVAETDAGMK